jgi:hypothetical protein
MRVFLEDKRDPVKVLFTGHRGSGKSTELNKLATMLEDKFFIVRFSILRTLNPQDMTYVDLLLALATSLFKQATDANVLKRRTKGLVGDELLTTSPSASSCPTSGCTARTARPTRWARRCCAGSPSTGWMPR